MAFLGEAAAHEARHLELVLDDEDPHALMVELRR
jgi:hypothetical protein